MGLMALLFCDMILDNFVIFNTDDKKQKTEAKY